MQQWIKYSVDIISSWRYRWMLMVSRSKGISSLHKLDDRSSIQWSKPLASISALWPTFPFPRRNLCKEIPNLMDRITINWTIRYRTVTANLTLWPPVITRRRGISLAVHQCHQAVQRRIAFMSTSQHHESYPTRACDRHLCLFNCPRPMVIKSRFTVSIIHRL